MKKLMIAACAFAVAAVAQAASIDWEVNSNAFKMQDDKSYASEGTYVWLVNADQQSTILTALAEIDYSAAGWQDSVTALAGVYDVSQTAGNFSRVDLKRATNEALVHEEYYNFAALVIDTVTDSAKVYANISDMYEEGMACDPAIDPSGLDTATFGSDEFGSGTGWTQVATRGDVPEPTSAMLLLLGMAGLALRRKQA